VHDIFPFIFKMIMAPWGKIKITEIYPFTASAITTTKLNPYKSARSPYCKKQALFSKLR